jgi:hypothetical protein
MGKGEEEGGGKRGRGEGRRKREGGGRGEEEPPPHNVDLKSVFNKSIFPSPRLSLAEELSRSPLMSITSSSMDSVLVVSDSNWIFPAFFFPPRPEKEFWRKMEGDPPTAESSRLVDLDWASIVVRRFWILFGIAFLLCTWVLVAGNLCFLRRSGGGVSGGGREMGGRRERYLRRRGRRERAGRTWTFEGKEGGRREGRGGKREGRGKEEGGGGGGHTNEFREGRTLERRLFPTLLDNIFELRDDVGRELRPFSLKFVVSVFPPPPSPSPPLPPFSIPSPSFRLLPPSSLLPPSLFPPFPYLHGHHEDYSGRRYSLEGLLPGHHLVHHHSKAEKKN